MDDINRTRIDGPFPENTEEVKQLQAFVPLHWKSIKCPHKSFRDVACHSSANYKQNGAKVSSIRLAV